MWRSVLSQVLFGVYCMVGAILIPCSFGAFGVGYEEARDKMSMSPGAPALSSPPAVRANCECNWQLANCNALPAEF